METACKNTEAMDTSILFERQHFRNACDIAERSKAFDTLTRAVSHAAATAISVMPTLLCVLCCPILSLLTLLSFCYSTQLFQRPVPPFIRVQIYPLRAARPHGCRKASSSYQLGSLMVKLTIASLRSSEKKNCVMFIPWFRIEHDTRSETSEVWKKTFIIFV